MQEISSHKCHDGTLTIYEHHAYSTKCPMRFSLFLPPQAKTQKVPYITYLSGLTCTEANFTQKAGAYKKASKLGLALLAPDTSPRGDTVPDDADYALGQGAGFYINATQMPWAEHYQMETYITNEFRILTLEHFPLKETAHGLMGHSMGGHGALTFFFKYPEIYKSVSAFAPVVAPVQVGWRQKAFMAYLGDNQEEWKKHDASVLVERCPSATQNPEILIDQGLADEFLETSLRPDIFVNACHKAGQKLNLRLHEGYDHGYFFIQTFIDDHLNYHHALLKDL